MSEGVLVDSNVLIDVLTGDKRWLSWSAAALELAAEESWLAINQVPDSQYVRLGLPWPAAFLAAKSFLAYRRASGARSSPLPDFYIGAHAAVAGKQPLTRDGTRYRTYFPKLDLIAP